MTTDRDLGRIDEAITTLKGIANDLKNDREEDREKFYNIFTEMNENLVKINSTVENISDDFKNHVTDDDKIHKENSDRIGSLENSKLKAIGYASGAGAVGGILFATIKFFIK